MFFFPLNIGSFSIGIWSSITILHQRDKLFNFDSWFGMVLWNSKVKGKPNKAFLCKASRDSKTTNEALAEMHNLLDKS